MAALLKQLGGFGGPPRGDSDSFSKLDQKDGQDLYRLMSK